MLNLNDISKFSLFHILPAFAYSGVLLTALPIWFNYKKSLTILSVVLYLTILLALFLRVFSLNLGYFILGIYWLNLAIFVIYLMIEDKNLDNFSIVLTLFGFCLAYFIGFDEKLDEIIIHLNAILLLIIAFKVSIVIGNEAIKDEKNAIFIPNFIHKNLAISFIVLYIIAFCFIDDRNVLGYISVGFSFVIFAKLSELFYIDLLKKHYILIYFFITFFMGIGYLGLGVCELFLPKFKGVLLDFLYIVAILGMLFFIFYVIELRHSKQELIFKKPLKFSFLFIFLAGISKGIFWQFGVVFSIYLPFILLIISAFIYFKAQNTLNV